MPARRIYGERERERGSGKKSIKNTFYHMEMKDRGEERKQTKRGNDQERSRNMSQGAGGQGRRHSPPCSD